MGKAKADTDILSRRIVPAGRVIFHADDAGSAAYIVRSGKVEIYRRWNGEDLTIAVVGEGEIFGEMAFFNTGRRSTFARALTECELVLVPGDSIERLAARAEPGLKAIVNVLVRRMSDLNNQIEVCPITGRFRMKEAAGGHVHPMPEAA